MISLLCFEITTIFIMIVKNIEVEDNCMFQANKRDNKTLLYLFVSIYVLYKLFCV